MSLRIIEFAGTAMSGYYRWKDLQASPRTPVKFAPPRSSSVTSLAATDVSANAPGTLTESLISDAEVPKRDLLPIHLSTDVACVILKLHGKTRIERLRGIEESRCGFAIGGRAIGTSHPLKVSIPMKIPVLTMSEEPRSTWRLST
jgi:hypothetical protein